MMTRKQGKRKSRQSLETVIGIENKNMGQLNPQLHSPSPTTTTTTTTATNSKLPSPSTQQQQQQHQHQLQQVLFF